MRGKRIIYFIIFLCFSALFISKPVSISAETEKEYVCRRLAQEPSLDGRVRDDSVWEETTVGSNFVKVGGKVLAAKQTYFRIGYTPEALFIGIECEESKVKNIKAEHKDTESFFREDSIEIFVFPQGEKEYHHFAVNAIGSRWNRIARDKMSEKDVSSWKAASCIKEDYWSIEVKIPFVLLGTIPEKNEQWRINICRNILSSGEPEYTAWGYIKASFHEPQNFGRIVFADEVSPEERGKVKKELRENIFLFSKSFGGTFLNIGGITKRISNWNGPHVAPRISPDRKKVLLHSKAGGKIGIWLTDRQGEKRERLCDGEQAEWSQDGKKIVFMRDGRIIEKEVVSGIEKIISPKDWSFCKFPSYLPDRRIIFVLKREKNDEVYLINQDKKTTPELLVKAETRSTPKCSPDGKILAYQDSAHIYLMDLEKKEVSQLTVAAGVQSWPMWSKDSKSICYCQSPGFFDGPLDIYNIEIKDPQIVSLVKREKFMNIAFDWSGSSPQTTTKLEVKGKNLNLEQRKDEIIVENDWLRFSISQKGMFIFSKEEQERIEFVPFDRKGKKSGRIQSLRIVKNSSEEVVMEIHHRSGHWCNPFSWLRPIKTAYKIPRTRPFIEIIPLENVGRVYLRADTHFLILPDRFANDLIFNPVNSKSKTLLTYIPFLIGLLAEEKGAFMVITPSDKQEICLIKGKEDFFEEMQVFSGEESIFISILSEKNLWCQKEVKCGSSDNEWKIEWTSPFHAQWRLAVSGKKINYSRMWNEDALSKLKGSFLPIEENFSSSPELSVVYAYGRSWHTPLNILTPQDILMDTLGAKRYNALLDIEGIRTYREADEWVPFKDFSTYFNYGRLKMAKRKGVESLITHFCGDIIHLLKGLDNRIEEYRNFFVDLKILCKEYKQQSLEAEKFLESIERNTQNLQNRCAKLQITKIEELSNPVERFFKTCLGTGERVYRSAGYRQFKAKANSALSQRQKVLAEYRKFVKELREDAGLITAEKPELRDIAEDIRRRTQNILRRRYYLEGDWQGEEPLDE